MHVGDCLGVFDLYSFPQTAMQQIAATEPNTNDIISNFAKNSFFF